MAGKPPLSGDGPRPDPARTRPGLRRGMSLPAGGVHGTRIPEPSAPLSSPGSGVHPCLQVCPSWDGFVPGVDQDDGSSPSRFPADCGLSVSLRVPGPSPGTAIDLSPAWRLDLGPRRGGWATAWIRSCAIGTGRNSEPQMSLLHGAKPACHDHGRIPRRLCEAAVRIPHRKAHGVVPAAAWAPLGVPPGSAHRNVRLGLGFREGVTPSPSDTERAANPPTSGSRDSGAGMELGTPAGLPKPDASGIRTTACQRSTNPGTGAPASCRRSGLPASHALRRDRLDSHRAGAWLPALWESGSAVGVNGGPDAGYEGIPWELKGGSPPCPASGFTRLPNSAAAWCCLPPGAILWPFLEVCDRTPAHLRPIPGVDGVRAA